ncbi:MAG: sigma-70 family RNA polymerase sigma factor [Steroidobacteraceae bacterium]|jgi:RNA polymerase sigma-70 factor (ECF subfamily)
MSRSTFRERQFEKLCAPQKADLIRYAFWLCRDRAVAEDIVQESLLRAWKSIDALENVAAVKPWLLTIVRREFARGFERKRHETVDIAALEAGSDPALAVCGDTEVDDMRQAMLQLEPIYREPLVLQVLFGYSTAEIAAHLEISLPAVLTRLFRAREKLREALA